ncbi:MAG: DUF3467 domain-containing protein [Pirellulaceae bacterium]|nr:DUF3467 domain-containing protein [Pirellulaceae bacterium]
MASSSESPPPTESQQPASPDQQNPSQVEVVTDSTSTTYANFCRVSGAPEEILVDFGVNSQPMSNTSQTVDMAQRIVMNYYTAKRFAQVLMMSLQQHEKVFGSVEVDVRKRITTPPK